MTKSHWTDRQKWVMGIVAALIVAAAGTFLFGPVHDLLFPSQSQQDDKDASAELEAEARRELAFRTHQVDVVIAEAIDVGSACMRDLRESGGKIKGDRIRDYLEAAKLVNVVAQLGGISRFPPPDQDGSASVSIGMSGYGYRHIPSKRGFRSEQFANDNLTDLVADFDLATTGSRMSAEDRSRIDDVLAQFEAAARFDHDDILDDWRARNQATGKYKSIYGVAYKVYEVDVDDYSEELERVHQWVKTAEKSWMAVKQSPSVKKVLGA